jgi:Asp-tRNA(Asn)/Glu-tRNA(Gln) amidotransferase A subunit family amidase
VALIETAGWSAASPGAKAAMEDAIKRLKAAGIEVLTRANNDKVAATETAIVPARPISMRINAWEGRWPLNTYRNRDPSKLSRVALDRLREAEAMTLDDYRAEFKKREEVRAVYAALAGECDMCISLAAPAAAPMGLQSTGDPSCTVHVSLLAIPAISLPVLQDEGLPLGLQVTGFLHDDAAVFAASAAIAKLY